MLLGTTIMAEEGGADKFFLERAQIIEDNDSEYQYEEVSVDEDFVSTELEEGLDEVVRTIQEVTEDTLAAAKKDRILESSVSQRPEVVDDFVRNFMVRMGMRKSLDCFQTEWYELQQKGLLKPEDVGVVPDVYTHNQNLDQELQHLRQEVQRFKGAALRAKETYVKLRKERDFHRMHHKRVVQEKNKLITDIRRLKTHYSSYEPTLRQLKQKYETAMKEKMLTKLERDRAVGQVQGLQSTLRGMEQSRSGSAGNILLRTGVTTMQRGSAVLLVDQEGRGPTQRTLATEKASWEGRDVREETEPRHPKDTPFPPDNGVNPYLAQVKGPCGHVTRTGGFRLTNTIEAHSQAVSCVALHPRKQVLASTGDDNTWRMWAVPSGDVIMTGEGHVGWVAGCDFHPSGNKLATVSGDTTVKIWDFARAECVQTFTEHTHAVWGCSWHACGDFLATCSMDNTSKIWDLNSLRCRYTLRGHTDSVNSIQFLPFSNTLLTCSADKTLSLWDGRTGLCAQTFYGHMHSVNHATFNYKGDTVSSCDSYGVIKMWDVRTGSPMTSLDYGPHPANQVAFDPSGGVLAIASNDATIRMHELATGKTTSLTGHEDAVQCLAFDRSGEFLVSGGSDLTVRVWS